jgi:L,D-transpeptidase catalytic domain
MHLVKKPITLFVILASALFVFSAARNSTSLKKNLTSSLAGKTNGFKNISVLFNELHLHQAGMKQTVFNSAIHGLQKLNDEGTIKRNDIITIIDFSQPSNKKRLYVLDLENKQILFNSLVAHGKNSGKLWARSFSNKASSLKSSPGFYVTGETYMGDNGYSLRLAGIEKNINDNARDRSIVMHGAPYVDESAINSLGFLGRSWGCPAIPMVSHIEIINTIKDGTCLFIFSPNKNYLRKSAILNS